MSQVLMSDSSGDYVKNGSFNFHVSFHMPSVISQSIPLRIKVANMDSYPVIHTADCFCNVNE